MRIGELAKRTGISIRAIRHYDESGLLQASRDDNTYRSFTQDDVERVRLIQLFLGIGFSLAEIRDHAPCWQTESRSVRRPVSNESSKHFLQNKLAQLDDHMNALANVRSQLRARLEAIDNHTAQPTE